MEFVNEEDDVFVFRKLIEYGLDAFLELSAIFGSGHDRGHVERHNALTEENARDLALDYAQGQAFDDG